MKKTKKLFISAVVAATVMMCSAITCYAANWGDLVTVTINSTDGWKAQFEGPYDYKETNSSQFSVYATAKTMTSSPSVRLINAYGYQRSDSVSIPYTGNTYTGSNNTGTPGYNYWTETKPAWNQIGTDTMRYQIKAD